MMKVAVVGSRGFEDYNLLSSTLDKLLKDYEQIIIISGGAQGADQLAEQYAKAHNYPTVIYKANWDKYGRIAGYLRNVEIVDNCDICVAFWDGKSKGTKMDIELCKSHGTPCFVFMYLDTQQTINFE